MATMPGMNADVFWGDPSKPPPDWREHALPDADDADDEYSEDGTPERRSWVANLLGFDPHENDDERDDDSPQQATSESAPLHETAAETGANRLARRAVELWESGEIYP